MSLIEKVNGLKPSFKGSLFVDGFDECKQKVIRILQETNASRDRLRRLAIEIHNIPDVATLAGTIARDSEMSASRKQELTDFLITLVASKAVAADHNLLGEVRIKENA